MFKLFLAIFTVICVFIDSSIVASPDYPPMVMRVSSCLPAYSSLLAYSTSTTGMRIYIASDARLVTLRDTIGNNFSFDIREQLEWALDLFNAALGPLRRIDYTFNTDMRAPMNVYVQIGNGLESHPYYPSSLSSVSPINNPSGVLNITYPDSFNATFQRILRDRNNYFAADVSETEIARLVIRINVLSNLSRVLGFGVPLRVSRRGSYNTNGYVVVNQNPSGYNVGNSGNIINLLQGLVGRLGRPIRSDDEYQLSPEVVKAYFQANRGGFNLTSSSRQQGKMTS